MANHFLSTNILILILYTSLIVDGKFLKHSLDMIGDLAYRFKRDLSTESVTTLAQCVSCIDDSTANNYCVQEMSSSQGYCCDTSDDTSTCATGSDLLCTADDDAFPSTTKYNLCSMSSTMTSECGSTDDDSITVDSSSNISIIGSSIVSSELCHYTFVSESEFDLAITSSTNVDIIISIVSGDKFENSTTLESEKIYTFKPEDETTYRLLVKPSGTSTGTIEFTIEGGAGDDQFLNSDNILFFILCAISVVLGIVFSIFFKKLVDWIDKPEERSEEPDKPKEKWSDLEAPQKISTKNINLSELYNQSRYEDSKYGEMTLKSREDVGFRPERIDSARSVGSTKIKHNNAIKRIVKANTPRQSSVLRKSQNNSSKRIDYMSGSFELDSKRRSISNPRFGAPQKALTARREMSVPRRLPDDIKNSIKNLVVTEHE